MTRTYAYTLMALVALAAVPGAADAQVYPERLSIAGQARRAVETAYQRRSRDDNREEQTERTTKVMRLGAEGVLALGNISGDITITRGAGADATIEILKTARGRTPEDAKALLKLVTVEATERNGRADVRARYPSGDEQRRNGRRNINVSVAYVVTAPAGTRISIESISGTSRSPTSRETSTRTRSVGTCGSAAPAASAPPSRSPAPSRSQTPRPTAPSRARA